MKKFVLGGSAAIALALSMSVSTPAYAGDASKFCKANADFGLTHGECTSLVTGGNNEPPVLCKFLRDNFPAFFPYKNIGACVSALRNS